MKHPFAGKRVQTRGGIEWLDGGRHKLEGPAIGVVIDVSPGPGWRLLVELEAPEGLKGVLTTFCYDEVLTVPPVVPAKLTSVPRAPRGGRLDDDFELDK